MQHHLQQYWYKKKFREKHIDISSYLKIVELNGVVDLDPFSIEYVAMTHSILEPNGLRIKTPAGVVLHTGDWKIDENPMVGKNIDVDRLKQIGKEGVLAMVCDSTNIFYSWKVRFRRNSKEKSFKDNGKT